MQSASHPKRIQIIGSDGARYRFLAKPQDDLRRDLRVMEFALLLNRLLEEDASTRGRSMQLQTFMCTPLGDQGGLVEWVLNTQTFQGVLRTTYAVHHYNLENINPGIHKAGWESAYRLTHAEKSQEPRALCKWMEQRLASVPAILHKWWLARYDSCKPCTAVPYIFSLLVRHPLVQMPCVRGVTLSHAEPLVLGQGSPA